MAVRGHRSAPMAEGTRIKLGDDLRPAGHKCHNLPGTCRRTLVCGGRKPGWKQRAGVFLPWKVENVRSRPDFQLVRGGTRTTAAGQQGQVLRYSDRRGPKPDCG